MTSGDIERMYQFKLSDYAAKVEVYDSRDGYGVKPAFMAISEEKALELIEEMLDELEARRR